MCVQRFDDSLNSAIHTTYRISLRSSSLREPRDPLPKVVFECFVSKSSHNGTMAFSELKKQKSKVGQCPSKSENNPAGRGGASCPRGAKEEPPSNLDRETWSRGPRRYFASKIKPSPGRFRVHKMWGSRSQTSQGRHLLMIRLFHFLMIQPQVHLRLPCYDFYFL